MSKIKIICSALAVVVGIGGAFASKLDASVTFYQTSQGNYVKLDAPDGDCEENSSNPCTITYATDPGVSSFTIATRPAGGTDSQTKNLWVKPEI